MSFQELKAVYDQYISPTYARTPLDIQQGQGVKCQDMAGKTYIDFSSGIGVNGLGFTNSAWVEAVKGQVDKLAHISNLYYTAPQAELAKLLCEKTGMCNVFFGNSGAEANEGAIKTARKYGSDHHGPDCYEIITLKNSFHGRTLAALAATGQDDYHKSFGPFPAGFVYAEANDVADLTAKVSKKTCAIMIECVQGEGGVVPLTEEFIQAIKGICAEKDILLVVDEVQTGMGRTGKFIASQHFDLKPDIATLAKSLGGGLPIGAVLFGEKTKDTLGKGDHGSTFGGNPIVCAGAVAVVKVMDDAFLENVADKGDYLAEKLLQIPEVVSVSGKGLMLGVTLEDGLVAGDVAAACVQNGLIVLTAKHKVRCLPPLTIDKASIDQGVAILAQTLKVLKEKAAQ